MTPTATDERAVQTLQESEAHLRECFICRVETPENACPEGKRLETRARMLARGETV
jgi:hypothetical protein